MINITKKTKPKLKNKQQQIIHIILLAPKSPSVQAGLLQSCHFSHLTSLVPQQQHNPPALISYKTACFKQTDAQSHQILQSVILQPESEHQAASNRAGFLEDQEYL